MNDKIEDPSNNIFDRKIVYNVDHTLLVISDKDSLNYHLIFSISSPYIGASIGNITKKDISNTLNDSEKFLDSFAGRNYPAKKKESAQLINMRGLGTRLFESIVPLKIREEMLKWKSGTKLCVISDEDWIPWEIFRDKKSFLGNRLLIFRLPRDHNNIEPIERLINPSKMKLVHIIGGKLGSSNEKRVKDLFDIYHTSKIFEVTPVYKPDISDLMEKTEEADFLHFTCHGHVKPLCYLQLCDIEDPGVNLSLNTLAGGEFRIKKDCLVFVNACSSAVDSLQLGDFSNLGSEFYKRGARFSIGTLGPIPVEFAIDFSKRFYDEVLKDFDIPQAFSRVKGIESDDEKSIKGSTKESAFQALYVMYGVPTIWV